MKAKNLWRVTLATLVLLVFLVSGVAAQPFDPQISPGLDSTDYLADGGSSIHNNHDGTVSIVGTSRAIHPVDLIWVRVYLQRYENGQWKTITNGAYKASYNSDLVRASDTISVIPGNYRAISQHQVIHNGQKDPDPPYISISRIITVDSTLN